MSIILRGIKGSPLTYNELDGNFVFLSQSYATTGSNIFIGDQTIQGNLSVFGTASFTYTTSSITTISASTFAVSISSPVIRYGFYDVIDSGTTLATSSLAWDSLNKYWVYINATGSVTSSAILLTGPVGTGGLGTEAAIPQYRIPMSNGNQSLVSSNIYTSGSLNIITGSTHIYSFQSYPSPTLGTGSGGFFLGGDNGAYGLYMGVSSSGDTWIQSNRNDNAAAAYNILMQPIAGNVNIGKINLSGIGPKLDISGSTVITGSLNVSQGITGNLTGNLTGTASYASFALTASHATNVPATSSYTLQALSASFATTASYVLNAVSASYVLNAVSSSFATTASYVLNSISSSFATTASYVLNAVSASTALSASFLRPLSQSVVLTGSLNIRNTTPSSSFIVLGRSGSLYIDFLGTGNNYIDSNILYIRNSAGTTNRLVISGSTTTINTNTTVIGSLDVSSSITAGGSLIATGSLKLNKIDGSILLLATSSVSSSISSSNGPTTASFNATGFLNSTGGSNLWDSNFDIYYSGVSGSNETEISPVYRAANDSNIYSSFTFGFTPRSQISLSPSGDIQSYKMYVYDYGSSNGGPRWYVKSAISENDLDTGIQVVLSGKTSTNFGTDLVNRAGFNTTSDPTGNVNTITYISQSILEFSSSLVDIKSPFTVTGSVNVSGSTSFVGTHILSGSNTIRGNTILSGSIIVSGSTTFRNTTFTVTGSQFFTGSGVHIGHQTITGSLNLTSDGIGTGFYINGQKQFNYISLYHTASILPTQNVSGSFIYSTVATSSGISLTNNSRITFANTGIYNIQFSAQLYTPTNNTNVYIWFKKNGTNIADSATRIDLGNSDYGVAAWNFIDTFQSGSYVEIAYQSDQTDTQFLYATATGNIPAIPSIIATVTQVA